MIGKTLAHFRITAKLGAGGMGEVYLAEDTKLERQVALKVLPAELADDPERLKRLQREARALAALDHPNIVTVFSVEDTDGIHFLTMAHVEGNGLDELIPPEGFSAERLLELAIPLADAVRAAHEHGIVHRDLKPANIMIDREDRLRVLDFGLARLEGAVSPDELSMLATQTKMTRAGTVLGTYPYMSPEQAQGQIADARSDIFSLGVILYEMATGRRPFAGETGVSLISSILKDTPTPVTDLKAGLPKRFAEIVSRCLEKDPANRYRTAAELRGDLEELQRELSQVDPTRRSTTIPDAARTSRLLGSRTSRRALLAGLAVFAVAAGLLGTLLSRSEPPVESVAPAAPAIASLAVLPLENLSGDPDQAFLAAGMTEALITDLSTIGVLKVISRSSTMRYEGSELDPREIARALGVGALVEGSVVREGNRVRVTANLIDAATAQNLWGRSFERDFTSVLGLQSDVAKAIAQRIEIALTPEEETRLSNRRSVNSKTYEAYLRGMHQLSKGTAEGFTAGIARLNEAVDNDPADPLAYAGLALGYIRVGHDTGPSDLYFPRAIAAARRALELDPTSAMAYAALADAKMYYEWDWQAAGSAFEQAIALNPSLAEAHAHYAWFYAIFGHWDRAIEHARRAKQLDPLSPVFTAWLGGIYYFARKDESALVETREALDMAPDSSYGWFQLGAIHTSLGSHGEAIEAQGRAVELQSAWTWALAAAYGHAGRAAEARSLLAELELQDDVDAFGIARVYLSLGDLDSMFLWIERACEERHRWVPWIASWPGIEAAHRDPRFQKLLDRLDITFEPSVPPADASLRALLLFSERPVHRLACVHVGRVEALPVSLVEPIGIEPTTS